jgi:hypothetical protein
MRSCFARFLWILGQTKMIRKKTPEIINLPEGKLDEIKVELNRILTYLIVLWYQHLQDHNNC